MNRHLKDFLELIAVTLALTTTLKLYFYSVPVLGAATHFLVPGLGAATHFLVTGLEAATHQFTSQDYDKPESLDCDFQCNRQGCTGEGPTMCIGCKFFNDSNVCVYTCGDNKTPDDDRVCYTLDEFPMSLWLEKIYMHEYKELFFEEGITYRVLAQMTKSDLESLGVKKYGHRVVLFDAVRERGTTTPTQSMYEKLIAMFAELSFQVPLLRILSPRNGPEDTKSTPEPCPFESIADMAIMFAETDAVKQFNEAMCKDCDWKTSRKRGVDCKNAKKAMRRLMQKFHPDRVNIHFAQCKMDFKPMSISLLANLTTDINKLCRDRKRRSARQDDL